MLRMSGASETQRLLHKYSALQITIEENIVYVSLMNAPTFGDDNGENQPKCGWFDHWVKCLIIVKVNTVD
jgi:hypothetical protein